MTLVVVDQGEEIFLDLITSIGYTLHLYTAYSGGESGDETDITEATFMGYSSKALTGGAWTTTPGDPGVADYAQQTFTSSADQTLQSILGYYITRTSDGALVLYEPFASSVDVQFNGEQVRVTPQITLADTQD